MYIYRHHVHKKLCFRILGLHCLLTAQTCLSENLELEKACAYLEATGRSECNKPKSTNINAVWVDGSGGGGLGEHIKTEGTPFSGLEYKTYEACS